MKTGVKIAIGIGGSLVVIGLITIGLVDPSGIGPIRVAKIKSAIGVSLRDPDSAQYEFDGMGGSYVCGKFNAKNAFGAYTGYTKFVASLGEYQTTIYALAGSGFGSDLLNFEKAVGMGSNKLAKMDLAKCEGGSFVYWDGSHTHIAYANGTDEQLK